MGGGCLEPPISIEKANGRFPSIAGRNKISSWNLTLSEIFRYAQNDSTAFPNNVVATLKGRHGRG